MTVEEFEAQRIGLGCRHCLRVGGLTTADQASNGGLRVVCPCGGWDPIGSAPYLAKGRPSNRKPLSRPEESVRATWARWQSRCLGCGVHERDLSDLGLGAQRQHAPPLATVGGDETKTTLVPLCTLCHEHVTANQRMLQRLVATLARSKAVPPLTPLEQGDVEAAP